MGTVATALGVLFIGPLAIRALAASGARLPIAARLALRDLARYQARSGAALAAISLAVGIAMAVVIIATAAEDTADEGNLSDRQLLGSLSRVPVWTSPSSPSACPCLPPWPVGCWPDANHPPSHGNHSNEPKRGDRRSGWQRQSCRPPGRR
jgi:hypothetical protein